jgi:hypothetical protein
MDLPSDDKYTQDRQQAVKRYLEDRGGLKAVQVEFHNGANPTITTPVAVQLGNYGKTNTDSGGTTAAGH